MILYFVLIGLTFKVHFLSKLLHKQKIDYTSILRQRGKYRSKHEFEILSLGILLADVFLVMNIYLHLSFKSDLMDISAFLI